MVRSADNAHAALMVAMRTRAPACQGDDRFTRDVYTRTEARPLGLICARCPVKPECRRYADTIPRQLRSGYWAGRVYGTEIT